MSTGEITRGVLLQGLLSGLRPITRGLVEVCLVQEIMLGSGDSSGVPVEMGSSAHSKTNPMADINLNNPDENDNNAKVDYSSSKDKNITVNF